MLSSTGAIYKTVSQSWRKVPAGIREPIWRIVTAARGPDYQKISFKGKTYARGTDRSKSYQQLFPEPPVGKTILDVGANLGYYSIRAALDGAEYCRALDLEVDNIDRLNAVATDLGLATIEASQGDVFEYRPERLFDTVLCLNVIQHFGTIERVNAVLDKLYGCAAERMALVVLAPADVSIRYALDDKPDPLGGKRFLRISPDYFIAKYGADKVSVSSAVTYGPSRFAIVVRK